MQSIIAGGGVRFGVGGAESEAARQVARYIDHTLLRPDATRDEILKVCEEGARYGFASVCINPFWAREAACALRGTGVKVCTVVGFPLGASAPDVKAFEARRAIFDGASELDMVINIGALKSGDYDTVLRDIAGVVQAGREAGCLTKVILETAFLTDDEKVRACTLSKEASADFVKTSTGFSKGGATAADVALMRRAVGSSLGVKAAGGVRDLEQAQEMIRAGATRIGASVGVKIVQEASGYAERPDGSTVGSY
jgi:deoxyribose-phosphate aldolase